MNWRREVKIFFQKAMIDKVFDRASSISFQALFSIIPTLAIAYFIFSLSGGLESFQVASEKWLVETLSPGAKEEIMGYFQTVKAHIDPKTIGIFGIVGFVWTGVTMISTVESAMNGLWGLTRTRPFLKRLWVYTLSLVGGPIALGISLVLTSFVIREAQEFSRLTAAIIIPFAFLVPCLITAVFFSLVYWALPYTNVSRKAAVKAGVVAGIGFEILKQGYALYSAYSIGQSVYGSIAILPILFLWIYLAAFVFILGAELCYFFDMHEQGVDAVAGPESHLSFAMLVDILRRYQREASALSVKKVVRDLKWDQSDVFRHVHYLAEIGLLKPPAGHGADDECYEPTEPKFEPALETLLRNINSIQYENLRAPKSDEMPQRLNGDYGGRVSVSRSRPLERSHGLEPSV